MSDTDEREWRDSELGNAIVNYEGVSQGGANPNDDLENLAEKYHRIADQIEQDPMRFEHARRLRKVATELEIVVKNNGVE